jgi:CRISPR-associated protein (TIGR03984 family)
MNYLLLKRINLISMSTNITVIVQENPMERTINHIQQEVIKLQPDSQPSEKPKIIINKIAIDNLKNDSAYLLAYTEDGYQWGIWKDSDLVLPAPSLLEDSRPGVLFEFRLFNENREIHCWKEDSIWKGLLLKDSPESSQNNINCFDEDYFLWGNHMETLNSSPDFILLKEGTRFQMTLPVSDKNSDAKIKSLLVRHYLKENKNGMYYISHSRLRGLK